MKKQLLGLALSLPLGMTALISTSAVLAQDSSKCDFTRSIGTCQAATAPRADGGVFIFTDSLNCASVDYVADGRKRRVFVTEGRGEDVTAKENVSVTSCSLYAAITPPKPVAAPQVQTPSGWKQADGTMAVPVPTSSIPTLAAVIPNSNPAGNAQAVQQMTAPTAAPAATTNSAVHQQLEGTWCDERGTPKLTVLGSGVNMMHKAGKEIPAPFISKQADGMMYATKRLFTTYSGKIGLDAHSQELVWDDRVSPGISRVHFLKNCATMGAARTNYN